MEYVAAIVSAVGVGLAAGDVLVPALGLIVFLEGLGVPDVEAEADGPRDAEAEADGDREAEADSETDGETGAASSGGMLAGSEPSAAAWTTPVGSTISGFPAVFSSPPPARIAIQPTRASRTAAAEPKMMRARMNWRVVCFANGRLSLSADDRKGR
nr:hypothetical protein Ade03nite_75810 [Actinoplanes derwentensis]